MSYLGDDISVAENRLIIGAGTDRREGWKTLDLNAISGADILAAIPPLPEEVKAASWAEIEWTHGITSLYPWEAEQVIKELREVMEPDGVLVLEQPDARKCNPVTNPEWLFGDASLKSPGHMNRWTYTPESLIGLLRANGFSRVIVTEARHHNAFRDFRIEARP